MRYLPEFIPYRKWDKNRITLFKIMVHGMLTGIATACSIVEGCDYYKDNFADRASETIRKSSFERDELELLEKDKLELRENLTER